MKIDPLNHKPLPKFSDKDLARFYAKIEQRGESECWPWIGTRLNTGYGLFSVGSLIIRATRTAYFLHYGVDPGSLCVLHSCDNPPCVNWSHLRAGTLKENSEDIIFRGRRQNHKGELHPGHKLTWSIVREMRGQYSAGAKCSDIATKFEISAGHVSSIVNHKKWISEGHAPTRKRCPLEVAVEVMRENGMKELSKENHEALLEMANRLRIRKQPTEARANVLARIKDQNAKHPTLASEVKQRIGMPVGSGRITIYSLT